MLRLRLRQYMPMPPVPAGSGDATPDPVFEAVAGRAKTAFWRPGRGLVVIADGSEHEFDCTDAAAEARMLARLKDDGIAILDEAGPRMVVFTIAAAGLLALLLLVLAR
ncbi:hypothetical protein [Neorhizobium vignae]|uniref:hypothetical protein n=1 Tax=Neorhizobium vignae TaxID=690585 RepID=UPI000569FB55|nr:hypothetical protein [Neorhizobium vignae]